MRKVIIALLVVAGCDVAPEAAQREPGPALVTQAEVKPEPETIPAWEPVPGYLLIGEEWVGGRYTRAESEAWRQAAEANNAQEAAGQSLVDVGALAAQVGGYLFQCPANRWPNTGEQLVFRNGDMSGPGCMAIGIFDQIQENTPGNWTVLRLYEVGMIWADLLEPRRLNDDVRAWRFRGPVTRPLKSRWTADANGGGTAYEWTANPGEVWEYPNFHVPFGSNGVSDIILTVQ